jgi:hypothetical protein
MDATSLTSSTRVIRHCQRGGDTMISVRRRGWHRQPQALGPISAETRLSRPGSAAGGFEPCSGESSRANLGPWGVAVTRHQFRLSRGDMPSLTLRRCPGRRLFFGCCSGDLGSGPSSKSSSTSLRAARPSFYRGPPTRARRRTTAHPPLASAHPVGQADRRGAARSCGDASRLLRL